MSGILFNIRHFNFLDDFGRDSSNHHIGWHIFRHHGSGTYNRIVADGHALQDSRVRPDPHILAQYYRSRISIHAVFRRQAMVQRGEHHIVPYLASVADDNSAMVLKMTAGIDEDILSDGDVLAEIRIDRRLESQSCRHIVTEHFGNNRPHF